MGVIYLLVGLIFLILYLVSKSYKKESIKNISSKENPLKKIYPMAMYIEDRILWKIPFLKSQKVDKNLKALLVKEKVDFEKYLYKIKKISLCMVVIIIFDFIGFVSAISLWASQSEYLESIVRPDYGEGEKEYELEVKNGTDEKETVIISIDEKKYSKDEIYKLFEDNYNNVIKELLGGNTSQDEIIVPINLISSYDIFNISWKIENTEIVDFSGNVYNEEINEQGIITYITAVFELEDIKKEYEIPLKILPAPNDINKTLEEKIQESLENSNSEYENQVNLPLKVEDENIVYSIPEEKVGLKYLIVGLLFAVTVYFGLDKDLEKKIKQREEQMLMDYSDIVSKLTLLMGAGLTISLAWDRIVKDYERKSKAKNKRFAFEEMKLANTKIKSGISETVVYMEFGKRCGLQCYLKLAGLLEQNVRKGTKELRVLLEGEVREAFNNRKNLAKIKGEEASTKLLFPMIIMLGIVIVIIVVPAFLSMNF